MLQTLRKQLLALLRKWAVALPVAVALGATALAVTAPLNLACAQGSGWTDAEVRKVDREAAKLTLKHGEIKNLDMPPMIMVFKVLDKSLMEGLAPGSKIRFQAAQKDGQYVVTALQRAP